MSAQDLTAAEVLHAIRLQEQLLGCLEDSGLTTMGRNVVTNAMARVTARSMPWSPADRQVLARLSDAITPQMSAFWSKSGGACTIGTIQRRVIEYAHQVLVDLAVPCPFTDDWIRRA